MERLGDAIQRAGINPGNTGKSSGQNDQRSFLKDSGSQKPECDICNDTGWVRYSAEVDAQEFGKIYPCEHRRDEIKKANFERLEKYSNLSQFKGLTFELTKEIGVREDATSKEMFQTAFEEAKKFAEQPEGWIVFAGPSGSGKTHLGAVIAHERLNSDFPALFVFIPDFLDHLRAAYAPDSEVQYDSLFQQIKEAPFLVLDDLGAQSSTTWAQEKLFQILNHRFVSKMPTVITLAKPLGDLEQRIQSRVMDVSHSQYLPLGVEDGKWSGNDALDLPLFKEMTVASFDPARQGSAELSSPQKASLKMAYTLAKNYGETPEGWLVLMGENGVGKTHLAASIAHRARSDGRSVLFLVVPDLLDHLRYTFRPDSDVTYDELFEEIKHVDMLVLDDLGAHGTTSWAKEKLYQIINYRYVARLPLVVTTNLSLDELERSEPRIASRLADTRFSVPFHIDAPNYGVTLR